MSTFDLLAICEACWKRVGGEIDGMRHCFDKPEICCGCVREIRTGIYWLYAWADPPPAGRLTFVITAHPKDYPQGFVVRRQVAIDGRLEMYAAKVAPTLEEARALVPPACQLGRMQPMDDPVIAEWWWAP